MRSMIAKFSGLFLTTVLSFVVFVAGVQAELTEINPGYLINESGAVVRSGASGKCVHTGNWDPATANLEGCDGIVLAVEMDRVSMFAFDSAELTPEGKAAIDKYREELKPIFEEAYSGVIIGHTDNWGDPSYNEWLSLQRAASVRDYLVKEGASSESLQLVGKGATNPVVSNETLQGRKLNRRVEIVFVRDESSPT